MNGNPTFENWKSRLTRKLEKRTQKSARMDDYARQYLPGGDTRFETISGSLNALIESGNKNLNKIK